MSKLKVYVVGGDYEYANFITEPIDIVKSIDEADIVLFTGGEDVYPGYYGQPTGSKTHYNQSRDDIEMSTFEAAESLNKLIVGICRGCQITAVMSGASLIQHVTGHGIAGTHKIEIIDENRCIDITSTHHQMVYPFNMHEGDYKIIAKAKTNLSQTYLDGDDCKHYMPENFVEPEIIYFYKTNVLGIQGHPEYMDKDSSAVAFINVLIKELLEDKVSKKVAKNNVYQAPPRMAVQNNVYGGIMGDAQIDYAQYNWNVAAVQAPQRPARARVNIPDDFFDMIARNDDGNEF